MPGQHQQCDITNLQIQLITTILKLVKHDVPVVALWYDENDVKMYGTKYLKNFLTNLDQKAIETAIKEDVLNLSSMEPNEPLIDMTEENLPERIRAKQAFQQFCSNKTPDELPFPLSCLNKKEKISWLTKEILHQQRAKSGSTINNVVYGDPNLMPNFWLSEEWDWPLLTKNLSNVTNEMYTGPGNFHDFLTKLIEKHLDMHGMDGETHYNKNVDKVVLKRKMKSKGVHKETHILHDDCPENLPDENRVEETEATSSAYRLPIPPPTPQQSNFTPRRTLPDNLQHRFPGCDPLPPSATPVEESASNVQPPFSPSPTYPGPRENIEPTLTFADSEYSWASRDVVCPPSFLANTSQPLDSGWKSLENVGADHVWLKDFKILRKYVHGHIIEKWHFYQYFYTFPLTATVGSGNGSYQKTIPNEEAFHDFLSSEESMFAYNTSQADIIALGNVLNVTILCLTYNLQGRSGTPEERTQWNTFPFNPDVGYPNVFSTRCEQRQEPLRILHEDEVHFSKLVWMPAATSHNEFEQETTSCESEPATTHQYEPQPATTQHSEQEPATTPQCEPQPATASPSEPEPVITPQHEPQPATTSPSEPEPATTGPKPTCSEGTLTRKRSRETIKAKVMVENNNQPLSFIVDKLISKKRKRTIK